MDDLANFLCRCQTWQETARREEEKAWSIDRSMEMELTYIARREGRPSPPPPRCLPCHRPFLHRRRRCIYVISDAMAVRLHPPDSLPPLPPSFPLQLWCCPAQRRLYARFAKPLPKIIITVHPAAEERESGQASSSSFCLPSHSNLERRTLGGGAGLEVGQRRDSYSFRRLPPSLSLL